MNQPLPPPAAADAACAVGAALRSPKSKPDIATPKIERDETNHLLGKKSARKEQ
jgi:hypothetical protein